MSSARLKDLLPKWPFSLKLVGNKCRFKIIVGAVGLLIKAFIEHAAAPRRSQDKWEEKFGAGELTWGRIWGLPLHSALTPKRQQRDVCRVVATSHFAHHRGHLGGVPVPQLVDRALRSFPCECLPPSPPLSAPHPPSPPFYVASFPKIFFYSGARERPQCLLMRSHHVTPLRPLLAWLLGTGTADARKRLKPQASGRLPHPVFCSLPPAPVVEPGRAVPPAC